MMHSARLERLASLSLPSLIFFSVNTTPAAHNSSRLINQTATVLTRRTITCPGRACAGPRVFRH